MIYLSFLFFIFILAPIVHELGHWLYFRIVLKKIVKFNIQFIGVQEDYNDLSRAQKFEIYFSGIILGAIPIFFAMYLEPFATLLMIPYLAGCSSDFKKIFRLLKEAR